MLGTTVPTEMLKLTFVTSSTFSDLMAVAIWLCFSGGGAAPAAPLESADVPALVSAEGVVPAFWLLVHAGVLVSAFFGAAVSFLHVRCASLLITG